MNNPNFQNMNMMAPRGGNGGSVQQSLLLHYRGQQQKAQPGWQQSVSPEERANMAMQFLTCIRLLKPEVSENEIVRQAVNVESTTFAQSHSKDLYVTQIKQKLQGMQHLRQQRAQTVQNNLSNPGQMSMMGQPGLQGPRPNQPQQFPQGFPNPQLQRPMQASPIPMSQGQSSMGMNAANLHQVQNGQQPGGQQQQRPPQQIDNNLILRVTRRIMDTMSEETKQKFVQEVALWPAEKRQQLINQNIDPLMFRFRQYAEQMLRSGRIPQLYNPAAQGMNQNAGAMQQPGQLNQMPNQQMNQRQPNQEMDLNPFATQQIEALRMQENGQQVVPASDNPNGSRIVGFPGQASQPGQAQNAALAQQRQAFQNVTFPRQATQAQVQQAQQAQAQARAQQQLQSAQAAQARNANQMLQGQIGGLNHPAGAGQSPAMPMLTRPMVPPGQPGPTTPQQQPQAHVPRMTPQMTPGQPQVEPQVAAQLMREVQQRQAAAGGQGQPLTEQLRMSLIPAELAPEMKQQLLRAPEARFRAFIAQHMQNTARRNQAMQNGQFPGGQAVLGQPNMGMNQAQAMQMGLQNQMLNAANLGNLGRAPGMNLGQPTPNGMVGQQIPMGQQRPVGMAQPQRLAAAQALLQQSPGIIQGTDQRPFPPNAVNSQVRQSIPPDVKTWVQLKLWASQNPNLMSAAECQRLLLLQVVHFQDIQRQNQLAQQQKNALAGGQIQQQNTPGVLAQPVQMPPGPLQQQPNIQVTPQEILAFRQKLPPNQAGATDQQLRLYLSQQKLNLRQQQQQQAMMNLQAQRNQASQPQPPMPGPGTAVSRPLPPQPPPTQSTPQPRPGNNKPPQAPKQAQPVVQNNMNQGKKRPNDDNVEPSTDTLATNLAPHAPAMVPSKSQQGVPNFTPEQMLKFTPAQQQQMRNQLLKAQQDVSTTKTPQRALPPQAELQARIKDPARDQKYRSLVAEEDKNTPRASPIQTSPEVRAQLQQLIKDKLPHIRKVEQALRIFLAGYEGMEGIEGMARSVIRARVLLNRQINTNEGTLQENLTISEEDFKNHVRHLLTFVARIMSNMQNQQGQNNAAAQNQRPQPTQSQAQAARQPQLNAANLKIVEEQQRSQKVPQAPTTDRPPFPLTAKGQSPRGAPTYFEAAPKVTNLVLPDKKRQKVDGQAPTSGNKASPHLGGNKGSSPELKRQPPPEKPMEQKPGFKCKVTDCEYYHRGFDTPAELEAHYGNAHARVDDPVQFAMESMAELLDVDVRTGQLKSDPNAASRAAKHPNVAARAVQSVKSGQTPNMSHGVSTPAGQASTPMARVPTQTGIKSSPSTNLLKTPQPVTKITTPSTGAPTKATPAKTTPTMKEPEPTAIKPELVEEIQPLMPASLFDFSYEDVYTALDTNEPFTTLDLKDEDNSWAIRSRPSSPINTPDSSSKDTPSTRQSDISENDNLHINLDVKDADIPDAWLAALGGNSLPLDAQLSEDLQTLGVTLPPMDDSDMMLFYGDNNAMMDFDSLDRTIENLGSLDPVIFG